MALVANRATPSQRLVRIVPKRRSLSFFYRFLSISQQELPLYFGNNSTDFLHACKFPKVFIYFLRFKYNGEICCEKRMANREMLSSLFAFDFIFEALVCMHNQVKGYIGLIVWLHRRRRVTLSKAERGAKKNLWWI